MQQVSTKPYLVRAIHEWCEDSGYRPFIAVSVDERTQVPREFVRNGEIVLNISAAATNRLHIGNELLEFEARFNGVARHVSIPIDNVSAIFAQENGHGMAFEIPARAGEAHEVDTGHAPDGDVFEHGDLQARHPLETDAAPDAPSDGETSRTAPDAPMVAGDESTASGDFPEGGSGESTRAGNAAAGGTGRTEGRRASSGRSPKRARKTVLRDVSAKLPNEDEAPKADAAPADADAPPARRSRKPAISAVPRDAHAGRGNPKGESDAAGKPVDPDDDPGPATPAPGKPHLTRVK